MEMENPNPGPESEYPECTLGSMVTPGEFWLINKCPTHTSKVERLEEELSRLMNKNTAVPDPFDIDTNDCVAVEIPPEDGFWKRGRAVTRIGKGVFKVFLVDSGQVIQVTNKRLRIPLEERFLKVEPLAFKFCLYGAIPCTEGSGGRKRVTSRWTDEAKFFVSNLFSKKNFFHIKIAQIIGRTVLGDMYFYNRHKNVFYSLTRLLCAKNLAVYAESYYKEKVMVLEYSLVDSRYLTPDSEVSIHIDTKLKRMEELRLVNMQRESDGHVVGIEANDNTGSDSDESEEFDESAMCDNSPELIQNLLQYITIRHPLRSDSDSNNPDGSSSDFQNQDSEMKVEDGSRDEQPPSESENPCPKPPSEKQVSKPSTEIQIPEAAVEKSAPTSLTETDIPKSEVEKQNPRPLMELEVPTPMAVIEKQNRRPLMEIEVPNPRTVTEKQAQKPITIMEFPKPSLGIEIPKPIEGIEFRSSLAIEMPKRPEGSECRKPLEGIQFLKPYDEIDDSKPFEEIDDPKSSIGEEISGSCEGIEFLRPLEDMDTLEPGMENHNTDPFPESEIPELVIENHNSDPFPESEIPELVTKNRNTDPFPESEIPELVTKNRNTDPFPESEIAELVTDNRNTDPFPESEIAELVTDNRNTDPFPESEIAELVTEKQMPESFKGSVSPKPLMEVNIPKPAVKGKLSKPYNRNNLSQAAGAKERTDENKKLRQGFKIYFDEKYNLPALEVVGDYEIFHVLYDNITEPVDQFKNLHIAKILFRNIEKQIMFERPTPIQKWGIPAIVSGDDLVILGEPRTGKTLAFILGALEVIKLNMEASQLHLGKGPLALVLSSSSKTCEFIYKIFTMLINRKDRKGRAPLCKLNVRFVTNTLVERHAMPFIINRCDILVSTPQSFVRVLNNRSVADFNKLNMVVYDGADLSAGEPFLTEMKLLLNHTKMPKDVQKIFCGERWTFDLEVFTRTFVKDHSAVIGSFLEAAVYANVEPNVYFIDHWEKERTIIDLILKKHKGRKVVIVCNRTEEVIQVEGFLRGQNKICIIAHSETPADVLKNIKYNWGRSKDCVVVCTQNIITDLGIYNADVLINYSLSTEREISFGDRFLVINNKMKDYVFKRRTRPTVDFLIDDDSYFRLPELMGFFQRQRVQIPPRLRDKVDAEVEASERELLLCDNVLKYGHCREVWRCNRRHNFIKDVDFADTPLCGIIKFTVLRVHSTTHLSVRLLELSDQQNNYKKVPIPDRTLQVARQLRNYYREKDKRIPLGQIKANALCVLNRNDASGMRFHRARIIEVKKFARVYDPTEVTVKLIDWGCILRANVSKLLTIPEHLKKYPPQAMDLYLCNLVPKDFERDWSERDVEFAKNMFSVELEENQIWMGRIKLSLQGTLLVDPVKLCHTLDNENSYVVEFSASQKLQYTGIANERPEHMKSLYALCEKANVDTSIYEYNMEATEKSCQPECAHFDTDFLKIQFMYAESPSSLYVRLRRFEDLLIKLESECDEHGDRQKNFENCNLNNPILRKKLSVGMCCLALNGTVWNRAKILSFERDRVKVFFIDYGDSDYVVDVVPIPENLLVKLPAQAIECYLVGVDSEVKIPEAVLGEIYEFVRDHSGDLSAKVVEKVVRSEMTGGWKYGINLVNAEGKSLNRKLIDLGLVKPTSNYLDVTVDMEVMPQIDDPDETDMTEPENWDNDTDGDRIRDDADLSRFENVSIVDSASGNDLNKTPATPEGGDDLTYFLRMDSGVFDDDSACCMLEEFLCNLAPEQVTRKEPQNKEITDKKGDEPVPEKNEVLVQEEEKDVANETIPSEASQKEEAVAAPAEEVDKNHAQTSGVPVVKARLNYHDVIRRSANRTLPYMKHFPDITIANISKNLVPADLLTPEILWSQTHREVEVKILLTNVATYKFDCTVESFIFRCLLNKKPYVSNVRLFGAVNPKMTRVEVKTFFVLIIFQKLCPLIWPRLCRENKKFRWIKYNIEHFKEKKCTISEILCSQATERIKSGNKIVPKVTDEIKFVPSSSSDDSDWSDSEVEEV